MNKNKALLISTVIACCVATVLTTVTIFAWNFRSDDTTATTSSTTLSPNHKTSEKTSQTVPEKNTSAEPLNQTETQKPASQSSDNKTLKNGATYVIKNTPNGDGLVMRSAPTSSSEQLEVIPEGTRVVVSSDNSSNNTGYVYVMAMLPMYDRHGYILKEYLEYKSEDTYGTNSNTRYVSYSTPEHKGLVLRSEPTYYSAQVTASSDGTGFPITIKEGEEVTIIAPYDASNNGYVYVNYNQLPTGDDGYYGWVLYKYLVS